MQSGVVMYSAGYLAQNKIKQVIETVGSSLVYSIFLGIIGFAGMVYQPVFITIQQAR